MVQKQKTTEYKLGVRNVQLDTSGGYDCEIKHKTLGWIPYYVAPNDLDSFVQVVRKEIESGKGGVVSTKPSPSVEELQARKNTKRVTKYLGRLDKSKLIIAEFAADNEVRLTSGVWTKEQLQSVINDPNISRLTSLLSMASFETAISLVNSLEGDVYTQSLKDEWVAKIRKYA
jgi:hypothetical protein